MLKGSKAHHYAQELHSARLKGLLGHGSRARSNFTELLRKYLKHNPTQSNTVQIAQDEYDIHAEILQFLEEEGFRDASHSNDTPEHIAFPPVMRKGLAFTERVEAGIERLAAAEREKELSIIDAATTVAMRAYGMFMLGLDDETTRLVAASRILESEPLARHTAPYTAEIEHHVALVILAAVMNGLALERSAAERGAERLEAALQSYARAIALHEQLRGTDTRHGGRAAPFVDEAERWTETALYRTALLTMRIRGDTQGLAALRAYQAKESRWPSTFRLPQRNVLRNIQTAHLNQARTVPTTHAAPGAPAVRTTSQRRVRTVPPTDKPTSAWSEEFTRIKNAVIRTLEQTASFPRADEPNVNAEKLADQLVLSWQLDGAQGMAGTDDVVDLLYGLTRITFRSQTLLRLLVHMLVAAEAYEEASALANKYTLLVETTWKAMGTPPRAREQHDGRGVDGVQEFLDTQLLVAHIEHTHLRDVARAHERVHHLLLLLGRVPAPEDEEMQARLPTIEADAALLARVLRAAGTTAFARARDTLPSRRKEAQDEALKHLREATQLDPDAAESFFALAVVLGQTQATPEALAAARRALELEPAWLDAWHLIVLLLSASQDFQGALDLADEALSQADADEARDAQAVAAGLPPTATRLVSLDYPPSARERSASYMRLFASYNTLVELTEGVQAALSGQRELFEAFRARFPLTPSAKAQKRAHEVALDTAPQFDPHGARELTETPAQARGAYRESVERRLLQTLWLMSAASFRRAGDHDQARDAIQEAENLDAFQPDLWVQLALWCLDAQKPGAAVTCLYKALACEADHVPASLHLARLLLQPDALHLRASHAETIAAVGTAQHGAEALTQQVLNDKGIGAELEDEARASNTRTLGAKLDRDDLGPVDPAFAWKNNPSIPPLSIAEGLLRTATLYSGHDVPEAWHLLAQFASQTGRPTHVQRSYLQTALRLQRARPVRSLREALALP
ncbi:hypothetical protein MBRA1_001658 [Malassezia brasiliensis]|uniref:Tetratricopeptide repeat protein n=1 Tax=Malassezia brasiliensis TaxID=1821822 RepID=A0AAF0DT77_9BASI|nr:hypothetical protein MBRA1_001658 [Malassezia brasiliensis]